MLFTLRVVTPEEYRAWIEEQKANPQELPAVPDVEEEAPAPNPGLDTATQDSSTPRPRLTTPRPRPKKRMVSR